MTPEEQPHQRWKNGRPQGRLLKESIRRPFQRTQISSRQQGGITIPPTSECSPRRDPMTWHQSSEKMAQETNLLNTEIHKVQEVWTGGWELKSANHAAKSSNGKYSFSTQYHQMSCPTTWGWRRFTPLRPYIGKTHTAPGVARRGKWGHCGESLKKCALPPRPHMCTVLGILCHEFGHYEMACILMWVPYHEG